MKTLVEDDLVDMGIKKGHRRLIMLGVKDLVSGTSASETSRSSAAGGGSLSGRVTAREAPSTAHWVAAEDIGEGDSLLHIKTLSGETFPLNVLMTDTIEIVKQRILMKKGIPLENQTLIFAGRRMENGTTLDDYAVQRESTLQLIDRPYKPPASSKK
jgi:hypothetical protein